MSRLVQHHSGLVVGKGGDKYARQPHDKAAGQRRCYPLARIDCADGLGTTRIRNQISDNRPATGNTHIQDIFDSLMMLV